MLALWSVCLLAATGAHLATAPPVTRAAATPAAVGVLTPAPDAAVIPGRVADEVRAATQGAPLRPLALVAALAVLVGLPAAPRRRMAPAGGGDQPLRARRHTIALRAPPVQFA